MGTLTLYPPYITFVKNNAGKITFATFIPTLLDEALASIQGAKLAKGSPLPKNLLKQLNRTNVLAWTTYLSIALIISTGVSLAVKAGDKIRDFIAHKREKKLQGKA